MFTTILLNILIQLIYLVVFVFVVGFLISLCNRMFYKCVNHKMAVCYATGFLGTPIHELGHALFCVIFLHRITEIKLFQIDDENGVLGYVRHSYNRKNPYHLMGNYFIGIAPILCGTAIVFLAAYLLLPDAYASIATSLNGLAAQGSNGLSGEWFVQSLSVLWDMTAAVFTSITTGFMWWIFALIVLCIALHMNLSGADVKGAMTGVPFVVIIIAAVNLILGFAYQPGYNAFVLGMNTVGCYLAGTLLLSLIFSAFYLVIGLIIKLITSLIGRRH